jgi:hypothetical protein
VPAHLFLGHRSLLSLPPFVLNVDPGAKSGQAESKGNRTGRSPLAKVRSSFCRRPGTRKQ